MNEACQSSTGGQKLVQVFKEWYGKPPNALCALERIKPLKKAKAYQQFSSDLTRIENAYTELERRGQIL